jgi:hypothetical protein
MEDGLKYGGLWFSIRMSIHIYKVYMRICMLACMQHQEDFRRFEKTFRLRGKTCRLFAISDVSENF